METSKYMYEYHHSSRDFATEPKNQKTYGRLLGMIYFGGVGSTLVLGTQRLAKEKFPKNRKNTKKSVKYFRGCRRFSDNSGLRSSHASVARRRNVRSHCQGNVCQRNGKKKELGNGMFWQGNRKVCCSPKNLLPIPLPMIPLPPLPCSSFILAEMRPRGLAAGFGP